MMHTLIQLANLTLWFMFVGFLAKNTIVPLWNYWYEFKEDDENYPTLSDYMLDNFLKLVVLNAKSLRDNKVAVFTASTVFVIVVVMSYSLQLAIPLSYVSFLVLSKWRSWLVEDAKTSSAVDVSTPTK